MKAAVCCEVFSERAVFAESYVSGSIMDNSLIIGALGNVEAVTGTFHEKKVNAWLARITPAIK